jgi:signal transduction histidine kinase
MGRGKAWGLVCRGAAYPGLKRPLVNLRLGTEVGIAGWVAHHEESTIVPDVSSDPRFSPVIDVQIGFHTTCVLAVPLRVHDKVIGVLEAVNKVSGDFDAHDCALLETLASSAAIAIENARLVENLRQQTAELSARNEELNAFAHTVAHDLKNPLYMLTGFSDLLSDAHAAMTDRERQECYRGIARVAYKMDSIVKELLLLAQVRQVDVETKPLNMAGILAEVQQRLAPMIAEYRAEVVVPTAWPTASGYAPWIEEVWVNYLSNALKYGGRPPRIELGAAPLADSPPLAGEGGLPVAGKGGGMVRFWVRDNGAGIAPEDQARLFVPFTRLSPARAGGHGLGLSIVRRIVEKLGGYVGVESQWGHGSVFSFTLPNAASPPDTTSWGLG